MKKLYNISLITALAMSALLYSSCKKVLEKGPLTTYTPQQLFSDSAITVTVLNTIYKQNQPGWLGNGGKLSTIGTYGYGTLTEENAGSNPLVLGTVTASTVGDIGTVNSNSNYYAFIRNINDFITNLKTSPIATGTKNRFIAQALFWRAYRYFEFVKLYGGVPLVLTPLPVVGTPAKQADQLARSTTTQTYTQIVADLDTAIKYLPGNWPQVDYGRITKGAAQAFLGRVLLTWASPQFNPSNDMTRWQAAYQASTDAIATLSLHGYGLYPKEDVTMWTTEGASGGGLPNNPEAVWVTEYNINIDAAGQNNNTYTQSNIPKALTGGGSDNPTWDEVLAFPMADGKVPNLTGNNPLASQKYTWDAVHFFDNRDPRFYQTIAYNGCLWPLEGNANNRLWTYFYYSKPDNSATMTTESTGSSSTGFYCRKAVDPNLSLANLPYSGTDWQEMRYAEVLLNQAECAAEIGNTSVAYADLIAIRTRAGIEAGDGNYGLTAGLTGDALVNAIMYERQIEFAYEGKRFWDLRRRNLLISTLNGKQREGISILLKPNGSGKDYFVTTRDGAAATNLDSVYSTYFSSVPIAIGTKTKPGELKYLDSAPIDYKPEYQFFGMPLSTISNDPNIQQNNTWGGSFDPLK
ncbi:MAG: RagB/SusD family nutrient uptake outer membrane protein [Sphingobacteriales bacterium]